MKRGQNYTIFCENYVILHTHIAKFGQFWASGIPK